MVFIGNICKAHKELSDGYRLVLTFDFDNCAIIRKNDTIEKVNGDLKIIHEKTGNTTYVDTAFVKKVNTRKEFL